MFEVHVVLFAQKLYFGRSLWGCGSITTILQEIMTKRSFLDTEKAFLFCTLLIVNHIVPTKPTDYISLPLLKAH